MQDHDYEDFDDAEDDCEDDQNGDDIFVIDEHYFFGKSWYFGGFGGRKECPKVHTNLDIDFTLIVMAPCLRREIACLPAMMKEGNCAIVISPAVSLTEDQVKAPKKKNERIYLVFSQRDKEEEMGVLDTSQCTLLILMLMSVLIFGLPHASSL